MPVGVMLRTMSNTELMYWMARQSNDPIGEERADLRSAIIAANVHNANITKERDAKQPTDFMPFYKPPVEPEFDKKAFFENLDKFAVRKPDA